MCNLAKRNVLRGVLVALFQETRRLAISPAEPYECYPKGKTPSEGKCSSAFW